MINGNLNNMNYNLFPNQFHLTNFNNNNNAYQNIIEPNMNQMNPNMNQINPNINQMNPNINQINPNINQINPNMNQINPNINQINPNINHINPNINHIINNQINEVEDILSYIDEPKMMLKFSTILTIKEGKYISVKLPKSITKSDLYTIAKKYQVDYYSDILLTCNNYRLKNDDTSIEGIEEGSIINIIEDIDYPDSSYYKYLMEKNKNYEKIGFCFRIPGGGKRHITFPKNITVSEMIKGAFSLLLLNPKSSRIYDKQINENYNNKISMFPENYLIEISQIASLCEHSNFGKLIYIRINYNNKFGDIISIGNLNSINQLIRQIENSIYPRKINKLIIGKYEFLINEIKNFSLKSIGINEDTTCRIE